MNLLKIKFYAFGLIVLFTSCASKDFIGREIASSGPIVGIFGDIHGDVEVAKVVLEQMKKRGVTHIIGTGDFVGRSGGIVILT